MGEHHHWFEFIPGLKQLEQAVAPHLGIHVEEGGHASLYHVIMAIFVLVLVVAMLLKAGPHRLPVEERIVPEEKLTVRTFFELITEGILGLMRDIIGPDHAARYLPLIGTLAVFILFSNIMGLIPGLQPPTSSLNTTLACSIPVFFATHWWGVKENGLGYFKHFLGPIVAWYALPLMIIMLLIEIISHIARPISLALRLFGNITGDHMVLGLFAGLISIPLVYPVPIMILGVLVAVVQTLVFCLLSMVYIGMAVAHEEH